MSSNVLDMKLTFLLDIASRIQSHLSNYQPNELVKIVKEVARNHDALFAYEMIACGQYEKMPAYKFIILASDPHKLLIDIIDLIKQSNSTNFQSTFNPLNIFTKLIDREFMLDGGGNKLCYCVKSSVASNYLLKGFACRTICSVTSYYNFVDTETLLMKEENLKELHPLYDYRSDKNKIIGGKKKIKTVQHKKKENTRMNIIARLIEYVRNNSVISSGIIFNETLSECSASAITIFYTENKFKDAIFDYLKLLINDSYSSYTFKSFLHADFAIPYDFRMRKYSCLINDKSTNQATYIANLYNSATYEPIPCIKSVIDNSYIHISHPIVKLRFLYIDMFMIEHKLGLTHSETHEQFYINKMMKAFNELQTYNNSPHWVGFYIDEDYAKTKVAQKMKIQTSVETILI